MAQVLLKLKQRIEEDTLGGHEVLWYTRTGEFERSWEWSDIETILNTLSAELSYRPELMQWNSSLWQHGNPIQNSIQTLADILNVDGRTSDLMFGGKYFSPERKKYWDNFISKMMDSGELEQMFTKEFKNQGMIVG